jgi:Na+-driven multidrug efflux pump
MLIGVGTGSLISISLGAGRRDDAEKCLGQAVALFVLMYAVLVPPAFYYMDDILNALGGLPETIPYARKYLEVILAFNIVQHLSFGLNHSMRAEGFPKHALATLLIGAILNTALDPFFIFERFWIFPGLGWGIRGAAVATVLAQAVSSVWVLAHFMSPKSACRLRRANLRVHPRLAWRVAGIGLSVFSIQFIASIVGVVFNRNFRHYAGSDAESALLMATMNTIQIISLLLFMPIFGLTQGMQPIVGYNHGAQNTARVRDAYYLTLKCAVAVGVSGALFCWLGAPLLAWIFAPKPELADLRAKIPHYLRVMTLAMPVVGFSITTSNYFQSTGKVATALFMSWMRQVIVLLPMLIILPRFLGVEGIWYSAPVSDFASFCVALCFFFHERRRLLIVEQ